MYRLLTIKQNLTSTFGGGNLQRNGIIWKGGYKAVGSWPLVAADLIAENPFSSQLVRSNLLIMGDETRSCYSLNYSLRYQSTTIHPEKVVETKKKKTKSHGNNYMDLMEVTGETANERRSNVKRLRAKKLQEFITKSNLLSRKRATGSKKISKALNDQPIEYQSINIEELENSLNPTDSYDDKPFVFLGKKATTLQIFDNPDRVKNIFDSFHNFREIIETIKQEKLESLEAISPQAKLMEADDLLVPLESESESVKHLSTDTSEPVAAERDTENQDTAVKNAASKARYKMKIHNSAEQQRLAREHTIRINLTTFLNACIYNGSIKNAMTTLLAYRERFKKTGGQLVNIDLYNIVLHGFARNTSFERFENVLAFIKEDGIEFNEQTFAAVFECLGRSEANEANKKSISNYIHKAKNLGFTLDQIMNCSKFVADQREIVLQAIQRVQPTFSPIYEPPKINYINPLLNHLDKTVLGLDEKENDLSLDKLLRGSKIMNSKRGYTKEYLSQVAREQLKIELEGAITIKSIEKSQDFANSQYCRNKLAELESNWRKEISAAITRNMNALKAQVHYKPNCQIDSYTYLRLLDNAQYTDILIKEIYKLAENSEAFSPTIGTLYRELGQKVHRRFLIEQKKRNGVLEKISRIYDKYCEKWDSEFCNRNSDNTRQIWQRLVHEHSAVGPSLDIIDTPWPSSVLGCVGRFLYNILMHDVKINLHIMRENSKAKRNLLPAFYTLFRNHGRVVKEEVKPHPVLARLLRASRQKTLTFDSNLVPMLCPPQPWSTPHTGGYLLNKSDLIRLPHQAYQQWERINSANPQSIYPALDSLNQLASIPWRVNKDILDVIIEVFQNGGDHKLNVPQPPSSVPSLALSAKEAASLTNAQRTKLFKEKLLLLRRQAEMYSLWCDALYRISLANHYRDKVFWLPHSMDFRGRVYPMPPHLNHLGSDLARSILIFDQAQPLGPDGFDWLKLHCINLTGLKKRNSVAQRLLFAEEVMEDILDSADKPLTGRMWWAKSDEPWQTLACCQEIAKIQRSPNPESYLCRFPVHQDGSCNGLQHYAALGRDQAGAKSVNLVPCEKPQDVYSAVALLVEKARKRDAENGLHVAKVLNGFIKRKVIKQTVMTTVYGVTRYGARLQIARQLKDIDSFPRDWVWPSSMYLTTKTFESLREMFTSTREIQDWFTQCARHISSVRKQNVEWCTPLGFPVVQPYNAMEYKSSHTREGSRVSEVMPIDMFERPNVMKQKNAFPPNFIHSLDSSHMMMTSLHCERKGLTFVSVHDCYWTHASTVAEMNKICREQFVALHSLPIIEDLSKFMQEKYSFMDSEFCREGSIEDTYKRKLNQVLEQIPEQGDFDLNNVLDSVYFFS